MDFPIWIVRDFQRVETIFQLVSVSLIMIWTGGHLVLWLFVTAIFKGIRDQGCSGSLRDERRGSGKRTLTSLETSLMNK